MRRTSGRTGPDPPYLFSDPLPLFRSTSPISSSPFSISAFQHLSFYLPMDFTIVTPSYNYAHYIRECLESVATQEGVTFEHLVMDAGSKDDTAEVVARFPHASCFQEPDKGMRVMKR